MRLLSVSAFALLGMMAAVLPMARLASPSPKMEFTHQRTNSFVVRRVATSSALAAPHVSAIPTRAPITKTTAPNVANTPNYPSSQYYPSSYPPPYYQPTYYQPSYDPPIYYSPSLYSPSPTGTAASEDSDSSTSKGKRIVIYFVVGLTILTLIAICCCKARIEEFLLADPEELKQNLNRSLQTNEYLIVPWSWLNLCKTEKRFALFHTTRIKMSWVRLPTILQFMLGWLSFFMAVLGFIFPENVLIGTVGMAALFLSELLVHVWYGFMRYWNVTWMCLEIPPEESEWLAAISRLCSYLYHKDYAEDHFNEWIHWFGATTAILHFGAIIGFIGAFGGFTALHCIGYDKDRPRNHVEDFKSYVVLAGIVGAVLGCLAFPLWFLIGTTRAHKIIPIILHHICLQYYEARLFQMSLNEFLFATAFKVIVDVADVQLPEPDRRKINNADDEESTSQASVKSMPSKENKSDSNERKPTPPPAASSTPKKESKSEDPPPAASSRSNNEKRGSDEESQKPRRGASSSTASRSSSDPTEAEESKSEETEHEDDDPPTNKSSSKQQPEEEME